jgi:hypothetical protein
MKKKKKKEEDEEEDTLQLPLTSKCGAKYGATMEYDWHGENQETFSSGTSSTMNFT